jgi:hypothetical protein
MSEAEKERAQQWSAEGYATNGRFVADLGAPVLDWLDPFLVGVPADRRNDMLEEITSLLAPSLRGRSGAWTADYVRLRFAAQLER